METKENKNIFETLSNVNVDGFTKEKMGLKYLSWAKAWEVLKKNFPDAEYKIYTRTVEFEETKEVVDGSIKTTTTSTYSVDLPYFTDGKSCFVKVGVIIRGIEEDEIYPIMDNRNQAIGYATLKMTDVNKALQRAFVKACARHGLGINIYNGEEFDDGKPDPVEEALSNFKPTEQLSEQDFNKEKDFIINTIKNFSTLKQKEIDQITNVVTNVMGDHKITNAVYSNKDDIAKVEKIYYTINKVLGSK